MRSLTGAPRNNLAICSTLSVILHKIDRTIISHRLKKSNSVFCQTVRHLVIFYPGMGFHLDKNMKIVFIKEIGRASCRERV